jgi:hypothetical protein
VPTDVKKKFQKFMSNFPKSFLKCIPVIIYNDAFISKKSIIKDKKTRGAAVIPILFKNKIDK